jgi:hypothetical protein
MGLLTRTHAAEHERDALLLARHLEELPPSGTAALRHNVERRHGVAHPDPLGVVAEQRRVALGHHRRGPHLEGAEADECLAHGAPHGHRRRQRPGRGPGGDGRGQRRVPVEPGDLLGEVGGPEGRGAHVGASARDGDREAAVAWLARKADRPEQPDDLVELEGDAEAVRERAEVEREDDGLGQGAAHVDGLAADASGRRALGEQLDEPSRRTDAVRPVTAPLEPRRRLGAQPVPLGAPGDRERVEPGGLERDVARRAVDPRRASAHDPGEADRRVVAVADDEVLARVPECAGVHRELEHRAVEQLEGLPVAGPPRREAAVEAVEVVGVRRLAELEHHVVRGVHDVVDRAHPAQLEAAGQPPRRRPDRDAVEDRDGESAAQVRVLDVHARRGPVAGAVRVGGRDRRERDPEARRQVARHALDAPGIGAVALDRQVEHDLVAEVQQLGDRSSGRGAVDVVEQEEAGVVVADAELAARAEHPVGDHPAHGAPRDLHAVRQRRPDRCERHERTDLVVPRAADHLDAARAVVDGREADPVRALDRVDGLDAHDHDAVEGAAHGLDPLHDEAEVVEHRGERLGVTERSDVRLEPADRDAHQNCLSTRTSGSMSMRTSGTSWRIEAHRSIPNPKANPLHRDGSIPTAAKTAGSITPQPPSSSHPVWPHVRHLAPRQIVQVMSNSADGSVNGK